MKKRFVDFMKFSNGMGLAALLMLTLALAFPVYGASDADHRGGMALTVVPSDGANSESGAGFVPDLSTTKVERSPLITELHEARRAGDEDKVRELEARLPKRTLTGVEAAGPCGSAPERHFWRCW